METKELKIQAPKGYEIDKENSTFECIRFKPIKKDITYEYICNKIFDEKYYYISSCGEIQWNRTIYVKDINNATNRNQLKKLLALNQLLNIAEYYNSINSNKNGEYFHIVFHPSINYTIYCRKEYFLKYGLLPFFNRKEDAQAVIDNPNFREILDTIYKG